MKKTSLTLKAKPPKSKSGKVVIENTGKGPLSVNVAPSSLSAPFTETGGGAFAIAPKKSHNVGIKYTATSNGPVPATLTITSDDPTHPAPIIVKITGEK